MPTVICNNEAFHLDLRRANLLYEFLRQHAERVKEPEGVGTASKRRRVRRREAREHEESRSAAEPSAEAAQDHTG